MLLVSLPGLVVLGRRSRRGLAIVLATSLALAIPAAGHALSAAGSTPDRLIVAIVPLLAWPVAECARWAWRSRTAAVLVMVLVVVSLDAALSYNWHHVKPFWRHAGRQC